MKDTPAAIERKFREMLLKRSSAERLKMGCSMHATARALAKAYLSQEHPRSDPAELKRLLFLHFYRADFSPTQRNRIASALSKSSRPVEDASKRTTRKPLDLTNLAIVKSTGPNAVRESGETYSGKARAKAKRRRS